MNSALVPSFSRFAVFGFFSPLACEHQRKLRVCDVAHLLSKAANFLLRARAHIVELLWHLFRCSRYVRSGYVCRHRAARWT